MKANSAILWIGSSLALGACASISPTASGLNPICTLEPVRVSPQVRDHLRAPLAPGADQPEGYSVFLRDLAVLNEQIRAHCE